MPEYRFITAVEDSGKRLDRFLSSEIKSISRSQIQRAIKDGSVIINESAKTIPHYALKKDDEIVFCFEKKQENISLEPEIGIKLDILWEDENFIVLNKPAGLVVHPDRHYTGHTLVNGLLAYDSDIASVGDPLRPGIVHRLDKDVSGVMVVARNNGSYQLLKKQFQDRSVKKKYVTLVHGTVSQPNGKIHLSISRSVKNPRKMAAHSNSNSQDEDREAITHYTVLHQYQHYALLRVEIMTGRTHQIRVHLNAIGYPIVGDMTYHPKSLKVRNDLGRIFLHAAKLEFNNIDNTLLSFETPLPQELENFLKTLA